MEPQPPAASNPCPRLVRIDGRPLAVAHQGGNHLVALGAAEAIGADLVETDVWLHRGRLEVRHNKTMGHVPLLWDSWSLQPGWHPRLELATVVEAAAPGTAFMLDLKGRDRRLSHRVIESMRAAAPDRPYAVCSPSWALLDPFLDEPGVRVVHSIGNERMLRNVRARVRGNAAPAVSVDYRLLTAERTAYLLDFIDLVISWTINTAEDARRALAWGVHAITSDNFGLLSTLIRPSAPTLVTA